jgi:hypothetical protein
MRIQARCASKTVPTLKTTTAAQPSRPKYESMTKLKFQACFTFFFTSLATVGIELHDI